MMIITPVTISITKLNRCNTKSMITKSITMNKNTMIAYKKITTDIMKNLKRRIMSYTELKILITTKKWNNSGTFKYYPYTISSKIKVNNLFPFFDLGIAMFLAHMPTKCLTILKLRSTVSTDEIFYKLYFSPLVRSLFIANISFYWTKNQIWKIYCA